MKWYRGNIPDAITAAKEQRSIFIVFVTGEDEQSKKMDETWEDCVITALCETENMVALRVPANSDICKQFSAIYPVFVIPCTFFIGDNGTPLEVAAGYVSPENMEQHIEKALTLHKENQEQPEEPEPEEHRREEHRREEHRPEERRPEEHRREEHRREERRPEERRPEERRPEEHRPEEHRPKEHRPKEPQPSVSSPTSVANPPEPSAPAPPIENRVHRAKVLIAKKQEEKFMKEKEEQKKKEKERRQLGQDLNVLKAKQAEAEAKEVRDQFKKDKQEEKMARQKIKEQIARDREERASKYKKEKQVQAEIKQAKIEAKASAAAQEEALKVSERGSFARIQFRLPDGSAITKQFASHVTLGEARDYLLEEAGGVLSHSSVELSVTYPKRTFSEPDMTESLQNLELSPSAAIIVVPTASSSVAALVRQPTGVVGRLVGAIKGLLSLVFSPFFLIWNIFSSIPSYLFGFFRRAPPALPSVPAEPNPNTNENAAPDGSSTGARPKSSYGVRNRQSKTRRLHNLSDDDDDSATWNGNSTQQL